MLGLVKKAHTYAGLLTFLNLVVFGIVGLSASFGALHSDAALRRTFDQPFRPAANQSDKQVADSVCRALGLTLALPVQSAAIQRDSAGRLLLDMYHANGHHRVTVIESEGKLRVEEFRASAPRFLDVLHMTTAVFHSGDWRMNAWAWYNEFAMWCLGLMMLSGVWIWLAGR